MKHYILLRIFIHVNFTINRLSPIKNELDVMGMKHITYDMLRLVITKLKVSFSSCHFRTYYYADCHSSRGILLLPYPAS